jgi:pyruvyl transferase EpsI
LIDISILGRKSIIRYKLFIRYLLCSSSHGTYKAENDRKKIVVALAADYGNLGDVAITYAQTRYLKSQFPEYEVIDFPISKTFSEMKSLKKIITPRDIITIVGGGNTGDIYDDIEYCRQFIIQQFPLNKIISFPQTMDFSDTGVGRKALQKAVKVYRKHRDLTLSAREEASLKKYKEYFLKNKVVFSPDIVLSLNEELPKYEREDITLCLRGDGEKRIDKAQESLLVKNLKKKYNIKYNDTHINKNNLSLEERELELNKIWTAFKKSKVVVTDRLHGMIFCAITKTPCIALDNSNHKISGVYNAWLKKVEFIKMIEEYDLSELETILEGLLDYDIDNASGVDLMEKFKLLI